MSTDPTELIEGSNGGDSVSGEGGSAETGDTEPTEVFDPTTVGDDTSSDDGGE